MKESLKRMVLCIGALLVGATAGAEPPQSATADVDTSRAAANIVKESAGIRAGELVLIEGGVRDHKLLEDIAVEVRKLGAHPLISLNSDRLNRLMFLEVDEKFDAQEPEFAARMADKIDAKITVDFTERPDNLADIPVMRRTVRAKAYEKISEKMLKRGVVQVNLGNNMYPTQALVDQSGIPYDELVEIFWSAANTDNNRLQVIGASVKDVISKGKRLRITAPNGTDLTVQLGNRKIFVSDGAVSPADRKRGGAACQLWLPAGEVFFVPKPNSTEGTFVPETFFFEGNRIEGLTLKFKKGKLISMTADSDITALKEAYDAAPKGRDLLGAIDIGINPDAVTPPGTSLVTWMGAGTISVGIGDNTWAGGKNDVPYGLYAHLVGGTLTVDERKMIVELGQLVVK